MHDELIISIKCHCLKSGATSPLMGHTLLLVFFCRCLPWTKRCVPTDCSNLEMPIEVTKVSSSPLALQINDPSNS
jgi:hypothetical protein